MAFSELGDDYAILRQNGIYHTRPLFVGPDNFVFASWRGGFVKISDKGRTSGRPHVEKIVTDKALVSSAHGWLKCQMEIRAHHAEIPVPARRATPQLVSVEAKAS